MFAPTTRTTARSFGSASWRRIPKVWLRYTKWVAGSTSLSVPRAHRRRRTAPSRPRPEKWKLRDITCSRYRSRKRPRRSARGNHEETYGHLYHRHGGRDCPRAEHRAESAGTTTSRRRTRRPGRWERARRGLDFEAADGLQPGHDSRGRGRQQHLVRLARRNSHGSVQAALVVG